MIQNSRCHFLNFVCRVTESSHQEIPVNQNQVCQRKHHIQFLNLMLQTSVLRFSIPQLTLYNGKNIFNSSSKFAIWKENRYFASIGKKLTSAMVKNFLTGKRVLLKGIKKKSGTGTYDAYLVFSDDGAQSHFQMEFPQRAPTK